MASVKKFTESAVVNQLRHIERTIAHPENMDIEKDRTVQNYSLLPQREISSYEYYRQRKSELYCYNRADVKVMAGWIVTAPKDLPMSEMEKFFNVTYEFLSERYGEKNCVQAVVHNDEGGRTHIFVFCLSQRRLTKKHRGEKIRANDVLNKAELRNFHSALQTYLLGRGVQANILTGITKTQGGNRTVRELKQENTKNRWQSAESVMKPKKRGRRWD